MAPAKGGHHANKLATYPTTTADRDARSIAIDVGAGSDHCRRQIDPHRAGVLSPGAKSSGSPARRVERSVAR
jgi:hypothetical protein